jgi:hypothetical protein
MNIQKLIWGLEELSDRELQEELWTGKIDGEMSSFVEAISSVFDDSGLSVLIDSNKSTEEMSSDARTKAIELDRLVKKIPQDASPLTIIQHPLMHDVRTLAAELIALIRE